MHVIQYWWSLNMIWKIFDTVHNSNNQSLKVFRHFLNSYWSNEQVSENVWFVNILHLDLISWWGNSEQTLSFWHFEYFKNRCLGGCSGAGGGGGYAAAYHYHILSVDFALFFHFWQCRHFHFIFVNRLAGKIPIIVFRIQSAIHFFTWILFWTAQVILMYRMSTATAVICNYFASQKL